MQQIRFDEMCAECFEDCSSNTVDGMTDTQICSLIDTAIATLRFRSFAAGRWGDKEKEDPIWTCKGLYDGSYGGR